MISTLMGRTSVRPLFLAALLPLFIAGCSLPKVTEHTHDHGHDHDHGHEHGEEEESSVTLWTDQLEGHVEFGHLDAGTPQEFTLHITRLDSGLPVDAGDAVLQWKKESDGSTLDVRVPAVRPGNYKTTVTFPAPGHWDLTVKLSLADGEVQLIFPDLDIHDHGHTDGPDAVHDHAHDQEEGHDHDHDHGEDHDHDHDHGDDSDHVHADGTVYASSEDVPGNAIFFSKEQQWVLPLVTAQAFRGGLVERYRIPATVQETPHSRAALTAPLSGRLLPPEGGSFPGIGEEVEEGQVLAGVLPTLQGGEALARESNIHSLQGQRTELAVQAAQARGDAERARALVQQHASALDRAERLQVAKAGSQREVEEQRSALASAQALLREAEQTEAQVRKALAALPTLESREEEGVAAWIRSPITGRITRLAAGPGTQVDGGQMLIEVVNADEVLIEGQVPEVLAPALSRPLHACYELPAFPGELFEMEAPEGEREPWLQPQVKEESRTVPLIFYTRNQEERLRIGMTLTLLADGKKEEDALQIPHSALVDENGIPTVYVMLTGEHFQKRPIRTGISDGVMTEVLDGLQEGDRVVVRGAYAVRLAGLAGGGVGSAHVH
ncbi:MAG TPA: efflux RND transporter periplasmic adaptor subunit [Candidatus Hydrogenedentes bacterium]|nr:MAG: Cation efflux system protein CusB precursor [Candidatus Hydrogenedentes bacterium ADurb.Bin170]HOH42854.1 efflux RND transporter periplasmic adaptor subunit [Candidatus Hydrogenedentota bacterium]